MSDRHWLGALQFQSKDRIPFKEKTNATQSSEQYLASSDEFLCDEPSQRFHDYIRNREIGFHDQSHSAHTKTLYTEYEQSEQDIGQFIENTKSLKQKIYQKLASVRNTNRFHRQLINEATFRPQPLKDRLAVIHNKQNQRGPILLSKRPECKTSRQEQKHSLYNLPWEKKKRRGGQEKQLLNLSFLERQHTMIRNKELNRKKRKDCENKRQLQECTFSPKLTPYRARRE